MLDEIVVRDGNGSWAMDDVNKAIGGVGDEAMIDPYIRRTMYGNGVSIGAMAMEFLS